LIRINNSSIIFTKIQGDPEVDMNILTAVIMVALLMTIGLIGAGIWSMAHGGEFDQKHSTQLMAARVGMQGTTFLLLLLAIFLAS
jgi:hypothetical protein